MIGLIDEDDLSALYLDDEQKHNVVEVPEDNTPKSAIPGVSPYDTDMNSYISWHKSHPQTSTPRRLRISAATTQLHVCEDHPELAYVQINSKGYNKKPSIPKEISSSTLGKNAAFKEVTEKAHDLEHQCRIEKRDDHLDPWWLHSVKVQSEIFHAKEPNTNNIYKEDEDEDDAYNDFLQKYNKHQTDREKKLREKEDELAISASWGKPNRHIKRSRLNKSTRSKYTINGKEELSDYYADRFEKSVEIALNEYYLSETTSAVPQQGIGSNGNGNGKGSNTNNENKQIRKRTFISTQLKILDNQTQERVENPETPSQQQGKNPISKSKSIPVVDSNLVKYQEYEDYKTALGGEKGIKKITDNLVKYSKKVNKQNQSNEVMSIMDRGMDFLDACLHLNSIQVRCLLNFGADPNSLTCDEEPVFFMIFQKVMFIDVRIIDEENRKNNTDRKSCLKILTSLLEFGADINCVVNGLTPLHLSCTKGNASMTQWLLEHHADPNFQCGSDGITPLMIAAKYSFPDCIIQLIRYEADMNKQNSLGRTALHYSAQFGQTKISKFLLRLGAQKDIKDEDQLTAGELALACNYMATSQVINGFCAPHVSAKQPLTYILNRLSTDDKIQNKKKLFFFQSTENNILGNLFAEKERGESVWERVYDSCVEWKRWFHTTPWNEIISSMFTWKRGENSKAMIHPEE